MMINDEYTPSDGTADENDQQLIASPYLMRPLRSFPDAKEMKENGIKPIAFDDRRTAQRHETSRPARATVFNRSEPLSCIVRDVSKDGARIEITDATTFVPKDLKVHVSDTGMTFECILRWRRGNQIGLEFVMRDDE